VIRVREPRGAPAPVVASIPHGGETITPSVLARLACDPAQLTNTDWHTPLLWEFLPELGIAAVEATLNRYVVDANRDPSIPYGDFRRACVAAATPWGVPLHESPPDEDELAERLALGHAPYHEALDRLVEAALAHHRRVLLLDLHSFGVPLGFDVAVGTRRGTTATSETAALVVEALVREDFTVASTMRFPGGWILRRFEAREDVEAVIVELHYSAYLVPDGWPRARPRLDPPHFDRARERLQRAVEAIVAGFRAGS
jgi:N-formylglutamate deformylase